MAARVIRLRAWSFRSGQLGARLRGGSCVASLASLYDVCDPVFRAETDLDEPGRNLALIFRTIPGNFFLRHFLLKGCRHPSIPLSAVPLYQAPFRAALRARPEDWANSEWIRGTFAPIAALLDQVEPTRWQQREPQAPNVRMPGLEAIDRVIRATTADVLRVWSRGSNDPYLPVAAQLVPTGDDHMDGASFLSVLCGLGAFENQNMCLVMSFLRCFLMANPRRRRLARRPYRGMAEPMRNRFTWIWHRTAFYDGFFFEQLLNRLTEGPVSPTERNQILAILENLVRFIVVDSREWLTSPNEGVRFPAITCLPQGQDGEPLCRLSKRDWETKKLLGFGDYVPDTDTTFVALAVAQRWLDLARNNALKVDTGLLAECERFLDHPWVAIIHELQFGSRYRSNPPTIQITKPLDYNGAVPIWFDKPFPKPGGHTLREILGNEICPGHNMDILDSILRNRLRWKALEGENLAVVQRFLDFHHRAYTSGNFRIESALKYYLPEIYVFYTGRLYDTVLGMTDVERAMLDPGGKLDEIRQIAIDFIRREWVGWTLNPFDAALAVSSAVLLRYPSKDDGVVTTALTVLVNALGEGPRGHPYRAYEWNRMRHPTRIIVGSEVSTSLFVMNAAVDARRFLYGREQASTGLAPSSVRSRK